MNLQKPQVTDQIAQLNARVTALEGANYDPNAHVAMAKFFQDPATATDDFLIYTHTYQAVTSQDYVGTAVPVLTCSASQYI